MIIPDDYRISINKEIYTVVWKEDLKKKENAKEVGILQCVFCLNFFQCCSLLDHAIVCLYTLFVSHELPHATNEVQLLSSASTFLSKKILAFFEKKKC